MTQSIDTHLELDGVEGAGQLLVRHWPGEGKPVLYVHGATFPSALSVGYRFNGGSWADDLRTRGFDVWAFDFAGFGGSARYSQMEEPPTGVMPLGRTPKR